MSTTDEGCGKEKWISHPGTRITKVGTLEDSCAPEMLEEILVPLCLGEREFPDPESHHPPRHRGM